MLDQSCLTTYVSYSNLWRKLRCWTKLPLFWWGFPHGMLAQIGQTWKMRDNIYKISLRFSNNTVSSFLLIRQTCQRGHSPQIAVHFCDCCLHVVIILCCLNLTGSSRGRWMLIGLQPWKINHQKRSWKWVDSSIYGPFKKPCLNI